MIKEKNPAAIALGRLGGRKGGLARAKKLTKDERVAIARKGGQAFAEKCRRHREDKNASPPGGPPRYSFTARSSRSRKPLCRTMQKEQTLDALS